MLKVVVLSCLACAAGAAAFAPSPAAVALPAAGAARRTSSSAQAPLVPLRGSPSVARAQSRNVRGAVTSVKMADATLIEAMLPLWIGLSYVLVKGDYDSIIKKIQRDPKKDTA